MLFPHVFQWTVFIPDHCRQNLDPEGQRSDEDLWGAVEIAQLKDVVQALPEGLGKR